MALQKFNFITEAIDWVFPKICLACDIEVSENAYPLCAQCYAGLPFQGHSCRQCGQAFAALEDHCGRCLTKPPHFDECFCPFQYRSPMKELVRDYKYHERPELAAALAQILARELLALKIDMPELIVAVPTHLSRLRSRGYNQSALLARQLSKILQIPCAVSLVRKTKATSPQAELSLKQREKNLHNCFALNGEVKAQRVAIIDDVVTTGSTAAEIAKTLKRNGVDYVQVWGIAHTV